MSDVPDLDRIIAAVVADADEEPLAQLAAAAQVRDELEELTEALLDHFVEKAREAGCSWSQIGSVLGVSKQAAQQRHTTTDSVARRLLNRITSRRPSGPAPLSGRFTPRAKASVAAAHRAAQDLNHNYIGTEHILLGILSVRECIATKALNEMGVTEQVVRDMVVEEVGRGPSPVGGSPAFTPRAKKVLERSLKEALQLGHNYIGTEHILLAALAVGEGLAHNMLTRQSVTYERVLPAVIRLLAPLGAPDQPASGQ